MKRSLSSMTIDELEIERNKMANAIELLDSTSYDEAELRQLACAHALKFAIECHIRNRTPVPALRDDNIIDYSKWKQIIEARKHG